jgi:hypothetical protein
MQSSFFKRILRSSVQAVVVVGIVGALFGRAALILLLLLQVVKSVAVVGTVGKDQPAATAKLLAGRQVRCCAYRSGGHDGDSSSRCVVGVDPAAVSVPTVVTEHVSIVKEGDGKARPRDTGDA